MSLLKRFAVAFAAFMAASGVQADDWSNLATISMTDAVTPKLSNRYVCYTDGRDIRCDSPSLYITTGGLVGINTSNPTTQLEVNGTISATNFVGNGAGLTNLSVSGDRIVSGTLAAIANSGGYISLTTGGTTWGYLGAGFSYLPIMGIGSGQINSVLTVSGTDLATFTGTTTLEPLTLKGGSTLGSWRGIDFRSTGTWPIGRIALQFASNGSYLGFGTSNAYANGITNQALTIDPLGRIGVNNPLPTATLQVSGSFVVSTSAQDTTPSLYVGNNGNVAIGTALSGNKLTVGGAIMISGGSPLTTDVNNDLRLQSQAATIWNIADYHVWLNKTSAREYMRVNNTGNVGISTSAPLAKLDVKGTISASDAIQVGQSSLACSSPISGSIRYNTTSGTIQVCNGTGWVSLSSGTSAGVNAEGDRITSGTLAMVANSATSYISLSTGATTWGYLSSGANYLPNISSNYVSASGVSVSGVVQVSGSSLTCGAGLKGAIRYSNTSNTLEYCNSTAWVSAGPSATQPIAFSVYRGSNQTGLATGSPNKVLWTTEAFDTNSNFASDKFTATVPGKYLFNAEVLCASATTYCVASLYKNGVVAAYAMARGSDHSSGVSKIIDLAAGDYVEVYATPGGGTVLDGAAERTFFNGVLLSSQGGGGGGGTPAGSSNDVQYNSSGALAADTGNFTYASGVLTAPTMSTGAMTVTGQVSASLISSTYVQIQSATTVLTCNSGLAGAMRYTSGTMQVCDGSNWGNIGIGVPTGTIAAFSASSCPNGWSEYTASRGRFLRGIDNGAGIDPDGTRAPGNTQLDEFKSHTHTGNVQARASSAVGLNSFATRANTGQGTSDPLGVTIDAAGGTETRPKNVAVIFCQYAGFQSSLATGVATLASLSDVSVAGATNGQALVYSGGTWIASTTTGGASAASGTGAVQFSTGSNLGGDAANFFWDNAAKKLGIGTASPIGKLDVNGTISASDAIQVSGSSLTCSSGLKGAMRYSNTSSTIEYCNGNNWSSMGPSATMAFIMKKPSANQTNIAATTTVNFNTVVSSYGSDISSSGNQITVAPGYVYMMQAGLRLNDETGAVADYWIYDVTHGATVGTIGSAGRAVYSDVAALAFVAPTEATTYEVRTGGTAGNPDILVSSYFGIAKLSGGGSGGGGGGSATPAGSTGDVQFNNAGALAADTGQLFWDATNNRLGIGTANPTFDLDVRGGGLVNVSGSIAGLQFADRSVGSGASALFRSGNKTFIWDNYASGSYRVAIDNVNGSIGIGTSNPIAKLDVNGTISASDAIQVSGSSLTCNSGLKGAMRYSNISGTIEYCQGTAWMNVAAADAGVYASYYSNAAQSIPNNAFTTVTAFGNKKFDSGSAFNGATFTAPVAGVYSFHAQTGFVNIAGGTIIGSRFLKNGATVFGYNSTRSTNTAADVNVGSDALIQLAANDTVVFQAWQVTGSAQNTRNDTSSFFDVYGPVDANAGSGGGGGATPAGGAGDIQFNDGSSLAADTGQLFWDAANNRLGIGSSSPLEPLHVGNVTDGGRLFVGEDGSNRRGLLIAANKGNELSGATYPPYARIAAYDYASGTSIPLAISPHPNAKVSIGKLNPLAVLDVAGTISASDAIQVGGSSLTCSSGLKGAMRYSNTSSTIEYCQGTAWVSMGPSATDVPAFSVSKLADQTVSNNVETLITWSTEGFDSQNNFASNRFTATIPGRYLFYSQLQCVGASTACSVYIFQNGVKVSAGYSTAANALVNISAILNLSAGDYVEVYGKANGGTSIASSFASFQGTLIASGNGLAGGGGATPAGSSNDVQYNSSGALAADTGNFTYASGLLKAPVISATTQVQAPSVSLTTAGTTWGYLQSGGSYLPTLSSNNISSTGVVQVSGSSLTCSSAIKGAMRYSNTSSTIEYCQGTAWVSMGPSSTNVPAFSVNKNGTDQTVTTGTPVKLTWSNEVFDTQNNFASDRFTPLVAGKYLFTLTGGCKSTPSLCIVLIYKNGVNVSQARSIITSSNDSQVTTAILLDMNGSTDYVEAYIYTAGTLADGGTARTHFEGTLIASGNGTVGGGGATPAGSTGDIQFNNAGALAADTGQLFWDATNNRLGIGTSAPIAPLQVSGTLEVGGTGASVIEMGRNSYGNQYSFIDMVGDDTYLDYGLRIIRNNTGPDANSGIVHRGLGVLYLMTQEAAPVRFYTSSTARVTVEPDGNVGIGTMTPDQKLTVGGSVQLDGNTGAYLFRSASGVSDGAVRLNASNELQFESGVGNAIRFFDNNASNERFTILSGGNVGIGTSAPSSALEVSGTGTVFRVKNSLYGAIYAGMDAYQPWFGTQTNNDIRLITSSTEKVRIGATGNVGIGTGAPTAKLQVQGTISASDAVQVGASSLTCNSGLKGAMRYSNTSSTIEYCQGTAWVSMGPSATDVPAFSVHKNGTNQTVATGNWVKLTWSTERFDTNNNFASDKFTPTVAGKYLFTAAAHCMATNGYCAMAIYKNNSMYVQTNNAMTGGAHNVAGAVTALIDMNGSTDYVEVYVYSGTATIGGNPEQTYFNGTLVASGNGLASSAAGGSGDIQFNNAGALAADTGQLTWDATNNRLGVGTGSPAESIDAGGGNVKMGWEMITNNCGSVAANNNCVATCSAGKYATGGACNMGGGSWTNWYAIPGYNTYGCVNNGATKMATTVYCANIR